MGSAILLFLPFAAFYFRAVRRDFELGWGPIAGGIAFGVAGHAALPILISADAPLLALVPLALAPLAANAVLVRNRAV